MPLKYRICCAIGAFMKPSDFFLSRRQTLGFLVPGVLWLATGLWICGHGPLEWFDNPTTTKRLILFFGVSYLVGYVVHSLVFAVLDTSKRWAPRPESPPWITIQNLKSTVRAAVQSDPRLAELNEHQLAQHCKRYAAKDSPYFQSVFSEFEDEVNLTAGMSVPLIVLSIVGVFRTFVFGRVAPD
jgi:hypothetical protein